MRYGKECVCGRGGECQGISAAFALLKDARRGYVQLPPYTPDPETYEEKDMNAMRAAYLRNLKRTEESLGDSQLRRYVALHHFHPIVVQKHGETAGAVSPIPKTVKKVDLKFLKMLPDDLDRVRDEFGKKKKSYYFVPTWTIDQAKEDLKRVIRVSRMFNEASVISSSPIPPVAVPKIAMGSPTGEPSHEEDKLPPVSALPPVPVLPPRKRVDTGDDTVHAANTARAAEAPAEAAAEAPAEAAAEAPAEAAVEAAAVATVTTSIDQEEKKHVDEADEDLQVERESMETGDRGEILDEPTTDEEPALHEETSQDEEVPILSDIYPKFFEQQYIEEKLPKNILPESEEGRRFLYHRMIKFEALRKANCTPLVEQFAIRWRASLEVMQAGIFETARAERLIRGAALTNKAYAEAMHAIYDDVYVDDDGTTVDLSDNRAQKRLAKAREGVEYSIEAQSGVSPEKNRKLDEAHTRSAMLGSLVDSQAVLAEKFSENYDRVLEEVVSELANLRAFLKNQMLEFKRRGDAYVRDIRDSEVEVEAAFIIYEIVGPSPGNFHGQSPSFHSASRRGGGGVISPVQAVGSYHGSPEGASSLHDTTPSNATPRRRSLLGRLTRSSHGSAHGEEKPAGVSSKHSEASQDHDTTFEDALHQALMSPVLTSSTSPVASALRSNSIVRDGWLTEMIYRQAVNTQVMILQKCCRELEKIWKDMQRIQVNRQIKLQEVLLDFMPRQRRLFLGLAPVSGPVLEDLVALRLEPQELEHQIEEAVKKHMQSLLKQDNARRSSIMNRSRAQAPNLEDLHGVLPGEFFDNGLLRAAKIVERKDVTGFRMQQYKTTLAVITTDLYLHLFDVSQYPHVLTVTPPEPVFELLLPDYNIPSLASDTLERRTDALLKNLQPLVSVHLCKCIVSLVGEDELEIVESTRGTIRTSRRHYLRIAKGGATQWLALLNTGESKTQEAPVPNIESTQDQMDEAALSAEEKEAFASGRMAFV